jgi:hypothetical protein
MPEQTDIDQFLARLTDQAVKDGAHSASVQQLVTQYTKEGTRERRLAEAAVNLCAAYEMEHGGPPRAPAPALPVANSMNSPVRYVAAGAATAAVAMLALALSFVMPWHERSIEEVRKSVTDSVALKENSLREALAAEQERVRTLDQRLSETRSAFETALRRVEERSETEAGTRMIAAIRTNPSLRSEILALLAPAQPRQTPGSPP